MAVLQELYCSFNKITPSGVGNYTRVVIQVVLLPAGRYLPLQGLLYIRNRFGF